MKTDAEPNLLKPITVRFRPDERAYLRERAKSWGWSLGLVLRTLVRDAMNGVVQAPEKKARRR